MALRLGEMCGNGDGLWIRLHEAYDLWHARQRIGKEVDVIPTLQVDQAVWSIEGESTAWKVASRSIILLGSL